MIVTLASAGPSPHVAERARNGEILNGRVLRQGRTRRQRGRADGRQIPSVSRRVIIMSYSRKGAEHCFGVKTWRGPWQGAPSLSQPRRLRLRAAGFRQDGRAEPVEGGAQAVLGDAVERGVDALAFGRAERRRFRRGRGAPADGPCLRTIRPMQRQP